MVEAVEGIQTGVSSGLATDIDKSLHVTVDRETLAARQTLATCPFIYLLNVSLRLPRFLLAPYLPYQ